MMKTNVCRRISQRIHTVYCKIVILPSLPVNRFSGRTPIACVITLILLGANYGSSKYMQMKKTKRFVKKKNAKKTVYTKWWVLYLPPARPGNLKNILYFVLTGLSGFVQLHVKLSQFLETHDRFVMWPGLSKQRIHRLKNKYK